MFLVKYLTKLYCDLIWNFQRLKIVGGILTIFFTFFEKTNIFLIFLNMCVRVFEKQRGREGERERKREESG